MLDRWHAFEEALEELNAQVRRFRRDIRQRRVLPGKAKRLSDNLSFAQGFLDELRHTPSSCPVYQSEAYTLRNRPLQGEVPQPSQTRPRPAAGASDSAPCRRGAESPSSAA